MEGGEGSRRGGGRKRKEIYLYWTLSSFYIKKVYIKSLRVFC